MSIVMGIDQHRAQITAEWIDMPPARSPVRGYAQRIALGCAGSWRGSLASSWKSRSRRRPAGDSWSKSCGRRGPWCISPSRRRPQQRIQAVLYHHGCPHRRQLMVGDGRDWLAAQPLPETARQQITVAVAIIDALEREIAPVTRELRFYARRQTGCKVLIEAYYGIGELCAVTIVSELGDCRRFANSRDAVRYGGLETLASNCTSCSGDFGLRDVAGVRDPLAAVLLGVGSERDAQAVVAVAVGGEFAV